MDSLERYFYSIELDKDGNKVIHLSGNVYLNDVDTTESNYRIAEWTFFYIPVAEAKEMFANDTFYEYVNERVNYLGDITKKEANDICELYHCGKSGTELHIQDISEETPCGNYWF